jgi:hypothetical protein
MSGCEYPHNTEHLRVNDKGVWSMGLGVCIFLVSHPWAQRCRLALCKSLAVVVDINVCMGWGNTESIERTTTDGVEGYSSIEIYC